MFWLMFVLLLIFLLMVPELLCMSVLYFMREVNTSKSAKKTNKAMHVLYIFILSLICYVLSSYSMNEFNKSIKSYIHDAWIFISIIISCFVIVVKFEYIHKKNGLINLLISVKAIYSMLTLWELEYILSVSFLPLLSNVLNAPEQFLGAREYAVIFYTIHCIALWLFFLIISFLILRKLTTFSVFIISKILSFITLIFYLTIFFMTLEQ